LKPNERRILLRRSGDTIRAIRLRFEAEEVLAKVQDISIAGAGILTNRRLMPGTSLKLEPAHLNRRVSPALRLEVLHTRKRDKANYVIGCRFSRLLTVDDVVALG
jgi:hypothetical protein